MIAEPRRGGSPQGAMYRGVVVSVRAEEGSLAVGRRATSSCSPLQRSHFGDSPAAHPAANLSAKIKLSPFYTA